MDFEGCQALFSTFFSLPCVPFLTLHNNYSILFVQKIRQPFVKNFTNFWDCAKIHKKSLNLVLTNWVVVWYNFSAR